MGSGSSASDPSADRLRVSWTATKSPVKRAFPDAPVDWPRRQKSRIALSLSGRFAPNLMTARFSTLLVKHRFCWGVWNAVLRGSKILMPERRARGGWSSRYGPRGSFQFRTYDNPAVRQVPMKSLNLDAKEIRYISIDQTTLPFLQTCAGLTVQSLDRGLTSTGCPPLFYAAYAAYSGALCARRHCPLTTTRWRLDGLCRPTKAKLVMLLLEQDYCCQHSAAKPWRCSWSSNVLVLEFMLARY